MKTTPIPLGGRPIRLPPEFLSASGPTFLQSPISFFVFGSSPAHCCCLLGCRFRQRPYFVEYTRSHPNSEVKRRKARSVLGWGTAREALRVLLAFLIFPRGSLMFYRINRAERNITVAVLAQRYRRGDAFAQSLFFEKFQVGAGVSNVCRAMHFGS